MEMKEVLWKRVLIVFLCAFATLCANAQSQAGVTTIYPRVGLSLSKFSGDKIYYCNNPGMYSDEYVGAKMKAGFTGGVEVQHMFTDVLGVSAGAMYCQQGTKYEELPQEEYEQLSIDLDYLNIPILFVASTNVGLNLKAGIQPEIRLGSKFNPVMDRVSFAIPVGISYEMKHFSLDLRYKIGVTKAWKNMGSVRSNALMLTLGYGIDL